MSRPALPPGLSMLWEQVDARQALRERFGFDGVDDVSAWVVEVLRQEWSIGVGGV